MELIFEMLGTPSEEDIRSIPNPRQRDRVSRMAKKRGRDISNYVPGANPDAIDLL